MRSSSIPNALWDKPERVEAWLAQRGSCVGASDAAKVAGLSPWGTALGVYFDKVMPAVRSEMSPIQEAGLAAEPGIAKLYERRFKVELREPDEPITFHPKHRHIGASLDRVGPSGIVELKNVNLSQRAKWGEDGTDECPEMYLIQAQQQMACAETDRCEIAALFGGSELRVYPIPRSEKAIQSLIDIETAFWQYVETKTPPPADWSHASTPDLIIGLNRPQDGIEYSLPPDAMPLVDDYERLGKEHSAADKARKVVKARIVELAGAAAIIHLPDGRYIDRKLVSRAGYEVGPCEFNEFRIRVPKGR